MREVFLEKAKKLESVLHKREVKARRLGRVVPDSDNWFQYRFVEESVPMPLRAGEQIWIDFGEHCTGFLKLKMEAPEGYPDAPIRLHYKLGETLYDIGTSYQTCTSRMCKTWMQEEIETYDELGDITLRRRFAFRYLRITVLDSNVPVDLRDFVVDAYSSADYESLKEGPKDERLAKLDEVGVRTLAECMQSVFEDGPRRDRRMWIGDVRLQALVNYKTFDNLDLVKRCLYLFAGYTEEGKKTPRDIHVKSNGTYCTGRAFVDYSLMFNLILCEYYEHCGDGQLVDELFDIADEQILLAYQEVGEDGIVEFRPVNNLWAFIDWCPDLKKITSMQGVIIYTLHKMIALCGATGRNEKKEQYEKMATRMIRASREHLYHEEKQAFVNHYDEEQYSMHSQVWMVLAEVLNQEESQRLLRKILTDEDIIQPVTPYMQHIVVEAMLKAGMKQEALQYIENYWGQMVDLGADTYWEVFVPNQPEVSPYKDRIMNSACHAWSCSPSYFIRTSFK